MSTLTLKNAKMGMKVRAKEDWNDGLGCYVEYSNIYKIIKIDTNDEVLPIQIDNIWFQPFELEIFEIVEGKLKNDKYI